MVQPEGRVVSYQARDFLRDCLRSIYGIVDSLSFEIIVVDNHSEHGALDGLYEKYPSHDLHIHRLSSNLGFAVANNIGARLAHGNHAAS